MRRRLLAGRSCTYGRPAFAYERKAGHSRMLQVLRPAFPELGELWEHVDELWLWAALQVQVHCLKANGEWQPCSYQGAAGGVTALCWSLSVAQRLKFSLLVRTLQGRYLRSSSTAGDGAAQSHPALR